MADKQIKLFGPTLCDTTAETVFTNTNLMATMVECVTFANPSAGAIVCRLAHGTDGVGTRVIDASIPANSTVAFYPRFILTGTEVLQLSAVTSDDIVVAEAVGKQWVV